MRGLWRAVEAFPEALLDVRNGHVFTKKSDQ